MYGGYPPMGARMQEKAMKSRKQIDKSTRSKLRVCLAVLMRNKLIRQKKRFLNAMYFSLGLEGEMWHRKFCRGMIEKTLLK